MDEGCPVNVCSPIQVKHSMPSTCLANSERMIDEILKQGSDIGSIS